MQEGYTTMNANESNDADDLDLGHDLEITSSTPRRSAKGTWVCGTIAGHEFEALVFPEHAANAYYEIGDSRISKLWLRRQADKQTVYEWDRGLSMAAADAT